MSNLDDVSKEFLVDLAVKELKFIRGFCDGEHKEDGFYKEMYQIIRNQLDGRINWWESYFKSTEQTNDFDENEELKVI